VFIFEVYDSAAAQAHRETEHFKKYAATIKDIVAKRELRPLTSVAMNVKGMQQLIDAKPRSYRCKASSLDPLRI
jgi:hypothetical protein